ncbi:MAG: hypothetical protein K6B40_03795 [Firmicutes bacterium]|nr:hypothetical protein [Bacillota bacterium]
MLGSIISILSVILTVVSVIIAYKTYQLAQDVQKNFTGHDADIKTFTRTFEYLGKNRGDFMDDVLNSFYRINDPVPAQSLPDYMQSLHLGHHLIHKDQWVDCKKSDGSFYLLKDIPVRHNGKYQGPKDDGNAIYPDGATFSFNVKKYTAKHLQNNPAWAMDRFIPADQDHPAPVLEALEGEYFYFYDTCESLAFEVAHYLSETINQDGGQKKNRRKSNKEKDREEEKRQKIYDGLPGRAEVCQELFSCKKRFPAIGVCAVTILQNVCVKEGGSTEHKSFFLLHKRTGQIAESIGMNGVIPSGSYQSIGVAAKNLGDTWAPLSQTTYREFLEEILGYPEYQDMRAAKLLEHTEIEKHIPRVYFLGAGYEPVSTKTEVLAAMMIDMQNEGEAAWLEENLTARSKQKNTDKAAQIQKYYAETQKQDVFLEKSIELCRNEEGDVRLIELTGDNLEHYEKAAASVPAMKEILRIVNSSEANRAFFGVKTNEGH